MKEATMENITKDIKDITKKEITSDTIKKLGGLCSLSVVIDRHIKSYSDVYKYWYDIKDNSIDIYLDAPMDETIEGIREFISSKNTINVKFNVFEIDIDCDPRARIISVDNWIIERGRNTGNFYATIDDNYEEVFDSVYEAKKWIDNVR